MIVMAYLIWFRTFVQKCALSSISKNRYFTDFTFISIFIRNGKSIAIIFCICTSLNELKLIYGHREWAICVYVLVYLKFNFSLIRWFFLFAFNLLSKITKKLKTQVVSSCNKDFATNNSSFLFFWLFVFPINIRLQS